LALSIEGMYAEMSHGFPHRFHPLTTCCYDVDVDGVVDLRTERSRKRAGVALADLACGWNYDRSIGADPASWRVADRLIKEGAAGILVPSFARRATARMSNLVLWKWGADLPHRVVVFDPNDQLPKDQSSWR
jgi:RES domain-containing protein